MKLTRCKLTKSKQRKLLEFFIAEVTARTAADLMGIQANTAILFYHKLRLVIDYHLSLESHQLFEGEIELDESYFVGKRKDKRG
jgi:transposase